MNPHPALEVFVNWLLNQSLQAGVLVLLVLFVQGVFRRQLTAHWRFALWWLVLLLLLLPFRPQSAFSLFNYCRAYVVLDGPRYPAPAASVPSIAPAASSLPLEVPQQPGFDPGAAPAEKSAEVQADPAGAQAPGTGPPTAKLAEIVTGVPGARTIDFGELLLPGVAALWLLGALALGGCVLQQALRFQRHLACSVRPVEDAALALLEDCRRELGVRRRVELLETDAVKSPALFGLFRLRLLLPTGLTARFSREQLRFIFLHELAHVKRGDLWLNWLVTGLQIMHWFNPLLWLGFARLRADRELACDELALLHAGEGVGKAYGQTIIQLLEGFSRPAAIPGLVGIVEDAKQMQRRIQMIARFKRPSRCSALAAVLVVALGIVGLTNARTESSSPKKLEAKPTTTTEPKAQSSLEERVRVTKGEADRVAELIRELGKHRTVRNEEVWTAQIRDLVKIGKPAVPALVKALDGSQDQMTLRLLGFTLRAIGDARAVPALIRAIPKGLTPPSSDYGLIVNDLELRKFMQKHSLKPEQKGQHFSFGRPIREICGALRSITGNLQNEEEVFNTTLEGEPQQIRMRQKLYHETARRWAEWWQANWSQFVDDPAFAVVDLTPLDMVASPGPFPTGAKAKLSDGWAEVIMESVPAHGKKCFLDLDTNRFPGWPDALRDFDAESEPLDRVSAWAASEGIDLMGVEFRPPGSDKFYYCLRGVGLQAWEIDNSRWETIKEELTSGATLKLGQPVGDLLMHYDSEHVRHVPERKATFLFVTRDGARGILRIVSQVRHLFPASGVPLRFEGIKVSGQNQDMEDSDIGFRRGIKIEYKLFVMENGIQGIKPVPKSRQPVPAPKPGASGKPAIDQTRDQAAAGQGTSTGTLPSAGPQKKTIHLSGRVVDAETKAPIGEFQITPGSMPFEEYYWLIRKTLSGSKGQYTAEFALLGQNYFVKATAPGYLSSEPRALTDGDEPQTVDFALKKAPLIRGFVRTPDGLPAAGAQLALCRDEVLFSLSEYRLTTRNGLLLETDAEGRFRIEPEQLADWIVVTHEQGYAEVARDSLKPGAEIKLQAWGKIEGIVYVGSEIGARANVNLTRAERNPLGHVSRTVPADKEGRFVIDWVPPVPQRLSRMVSIGTMMMGSHPTFVDVRPGLVSAVRLGGDGRTVIGSARVKPPGQNFDPENGYLVIRTAGNKNIRAYVAPLAKDGSFRVVDVPPGHYQLRFEQTNINSQIGEKMAQHRANPEADLMFDPIKSFTTEIDVSAGTPEDGQKPVNLRLFEFTWSN